MSVQKKQRQIMRTVQLATARALDEMGLMLQYQDIKEFETAVEHNEVNPCAIMDIIRIATRDVKAFNKPLCNNTIEAFGQDLSCEQLIEILRPYCEGYQDIFKGFYEGIKHHEHGKTPPVKRGGMKDYWGYSYFGNP